MGTGNSAGPFRPVVLLRSAGTVGLESEADRTQRTSPRRRKDPERKPLRVERPPLQARNPAIRAWC
jgi:hypothetical protein